MLDGAEPAGSCLPRGPGLKAYSGLLWHISLPGLALSSSFDTADKMYGGSWVFKFSIRRVVKSFFVRKVTHLPFYKDENSWQRSMRFQVRQQAAHDFSDAFVSHANP